MLISACMFVFIQVADEALSACTLQQIKHNWEVACQSLKSAAKKMGKEKKKLKTIKDAVRYGHNIFHFSGCLHIKLNPILKKIFFFFVYAHHHSV